jgi:hypothetical protein
MAVGSDDGGESMPEPARVTIKRHKTTAQDHLQMQVKREVGMKRPRNEKRKSLFDAQDQVDA